MQAIRRIDDRVEIHSATGGRELFDYVFLACHSDQALALLKDATDAEREVLGAIRYQPNEAVLHTDQSLMPTRPRAWAAWNYLIPTDTTRHVAVTYNMNILQGIEAPETFCVTLNNSDAINPHKVLGRFQYDHPVFSLPGMAAQQRWHEINGVQDTWYCGAYWHNGFHEDGVVSALRVSQALAEQARVAA